MRQTPPVCKLGRLPLLGATGVPSYSVSHALKLSLRSCISLDIFMRKAHRFYDRFYLLLARARCKSLWGSGSRCSRLCFSRSSCLAARCACIMGQRVKHWKPVTACSLHGPRTDSTGSTWLLLSLRSCVCQKCRHMESLSLSLTHPLSVLSSLCRSGKVEAVARISGTVDHLNRAAPPGCRA